MKIVPAKPTVLMAAILTAVVLPAIGFAGKPVQRELGRYRCGCRKHCYCQQEPLPRDIPQGFTSRYSGFPSGPIVESVPMMRATPALVAMPMMLGRDVRSQQPCADDRIDELEERVEALFTQLKVIQRAVEIQTTVLEQLRQEGPR